MQIFIIFSAIIIKSILCKLFALLLFVLFFYYKQLLFKKNKQMFNKYIKKVKLKSIEKFIFVIYLISSFSSFLIIYFYLDMFKIPNSMDISFLIFSFGLLLTLYRWEKSFKLYIYEKFNNIIDNIDNIED